MSFANLSSLARQHPLRMLLVNAGEADAITWAGLVQPLRLAAAQLGRDVLQLETMTPAQVVLAQPGWHLALLVADEQQAPLPPEQCRAVIERCRSAEYWGGVGAGVLWLAKAGLMAGVRIALPWALYADTEDITERAILTPHLFELDGRHLSCCGGAASIDFALTLIEQLFGAGIQATVKESLCVERVRGPEERQRVALQARFGALQPRLSEAVTLMEDQYRRTAVDRRHRQPGRPVAAPAGAAVQAIPGQPAVRATTWNYGCNERASYCWTPIIRSCKLG